MAAMTTSDRIVAVSILSFLITWRCSLIITKHGKNWTIINISHECRRLRLHGVNDVSLSSVRRMVVPVMIRSDVVSRIMTFITHNDPITVFVVVVVMVIVFIVSGRFPHFVHVCVVRFMIARVVWRRQRSTRCSAAHHVTILHFTIVLFVILVLGWGNLETEVLWKLVNNDTKSSVELKHQNRGGPFHAKSASWPLSDFSQALNQNMLLISNATSPSLSP